MSNTNRLDYLDTAKGVLIILVILGHVFFKYPYMNFVYSFHLSSFLIITGILFFHVSKVKRPFVKSFKTAIYTLFIPFIFFETIGCLIKIAHGSQFVFPWSVLNPFLGSYYVGADWYLQTAFFSELLFIGFEKTKASQYIKLPLYALMFIVGCLLPRDQFRYILLNRVFISTAFIAIGYYLYNVFTMIDIRLIIASTIITILCSTFNGYVSLYSIAIGNPVLYLLGAVSGGYMCIALCHLIKMNQLRTIGKNSLILMGTHQNLISYVHINKILLVLLIFAVEIPIVFLVRKYLPFCVGIKKQHKQQ